MVHTVCKTQTLAGGGCQPGHLGEPGRVLAVPRESYLKFGEVLRDNVLICQGVIPSW